MRIDLVARVAVALVVLGLAAGHAATLLAPSTWINRDGRFYANMNATLVEDGTLEQGRFAASWYSGAYGWNRDLPRGFSNVALGRHGEHWPMHPWLMPVLATPFWLAFGLGGTLVFNLLGFGVIGLGAYRYAREHASGVGAAAGTVLFLLGTAILDYAYDYHVDVFLLACVATAVAALHDRQGVVAGVFVAAALAVKPTTVLIVPFLLALLAARRDGATLRGAVAGGAAVLGVVAIANTFMFGTPWTFGYQRIVTVVGGEKVIDHDVAAFDTPLAAGLERMWRGWWGVRHSATLFVLAVPGLAALLARRRWLVAVGGTLTLAAAVLVFARYAHEGHRFLWPAAFLLVPALAAAFDLARAGVGRALAALRPRARPSAALGAAALCAALALAGGAWSAAFGPDAADRFARDPYAMGAVALGELGTLDPAALPGVDPDGLGAPGARLAARLAGGARVVRAALVPVVLAAPFAALGGAGALVALHLALAALAAGAAGWTAATRVRPSIAVAAVGGLFLLPAVRDAAVTGGPGAFAAAALALCVATALARRPVVAVVCGGLAAWLAEVPILLAVPAGVALLAAVEAAERGVGRRARPAGLALLAVLVVWVAAHLALYGHPFGTPDDRTLVHLEAGVGEALPLPRAALLDPEGPPRAVAPTPRVPVGVRLAGALLAGAGGLELALAWLAVAGLGGLGALALGLAGRSAGLRGQLPLAVAWSAVLLAPLAADAPTARMTLLAAVGLGAPAGALAAAAAAVAAPRWSRAGARGRLAVGLAAVALLSAGGLARRAAEAAAPFEVASRPAVRRAVVHLGDVPCDFLAWEHYAWECSHLDRGGPTSLTGLATTADLRVGGRPTAGFVLASGGRGQPRRVSWRGVEARDRLVLEWAVPDGHRGGGELVVRVNGAEVGRVRTPEAPTERLTRWTLDTSAQAGRDVALELELGPGPYGASTTVLRGGFRAADDDRPLTSPTTP